MKLLIKPCANVRKHLYITPKGVIIAKSLARAAALAESVHVHEVKLLQTECPIYSGNRVFKATFTESNGYETETSETYVVGFSKQVVLAELKHSDLIDCSTLSIDVEETPMRVMKIIRKVD